MSLDPNKTYLVWNGTEFPNSTNAQFKAPAGSTIDWGDGTVETFDAASTTVNTHTYADGKAEHTIAISGLTSIGDDAFAYCSSLISVTIGNSVTSIDPYAFRDCSSLTSVTIGNSVTSIWGSVFYNCRSLTSVTIPNSVTSIGSSAFRDCSSLTSVTIPNSVTTIGPSAFAYCSSLTQLILFPSTPPTLGSYATPNNVQSIYVQQSSKAAYQAATNWTTFASKIIGDNIYLSFVRFNQKNKEYIDDKVKESEQYVFDALNIQNGSGVKSIQQGADPKYNGVIKAASKNPYAKILYPELTDAEPLGAIGDYAASFGGNSSVQAKRGIGGGTSSVTKGAYSQSLGDNTVTTPKASDSTAIGYQTTTDAPGAFTHGSFTVVMSQKYIEGMFDPNIEPGQGGSGQPTEPGTTPADTLEMDNRRGEAASAGGFNSYSSGFAAETDGVSNVADGHISKSSGRSNRSWSYLSKTDGKNSVVKPDPTNTDATGEGSWANGDNIQIIGAKYAYSGGSNNIVFAGADNSFSYGEGLQVKHKNQVVIGQYNDSSDSTNNDLVVVGAGTGNSNRKNAIRVTENGKLYYGDFEVSNLKTTNDAIVSLDNKLTPKITGNTTEITKLWSTLRDTNTNLNRLNETKQATLVSGTNIKTINGNSLLGSGDLIIAGGGSGGVTSVTTSGTGNAVTAASISGDTLTLIKGSTFALITDIPDTSNFVTLSDAQTISGAKTLSNHLSLTYGPEGYIDFGNNWKLFGYYMKNGTDTSLSFPSGKNGTIALTDDIDVTAAGNNTFSGTNTFDNLIEIGGTGRPGTPGFGYCKLRVSWGLGDTDSPYSDYEPTRISFKHLNSSTPYSLAFPQKSGTLALTSDLPDTSNFVTLSGAQEISGNKTFTGINRFTGTNTFTTILSCANGIVSPTIYPDSGYTLTVPKKDGTLATTSDIPIKTATLSGTTLSITLS